MTGSVDTKQRKGGRLSSSRRCRPLLLCSSLLFCYGRIADAQLTYSCPGGVAGIAEAFFERFTLFQAKYVRDSLQRSREFLYTLYLPKLSSDLDGSLRTCPAAVMELMMNSLLALDVDFSIGETRELYQRTMAAATVLQEHLPEVQELVKKWQVETVHTYGYLLGLQPPPVTPPSSIKVYVYELPQALEASALHCGIGQWGTEVLFHRFFSETAFRTEDPRNADFFFVPIYSTCLWTTRGIQNELEAADIIWTPLMEFLTSMPWLQRRKARDHIFLFADGMSSRVWDSYDLITREAVAMMVESKCPTWGEPIRRYTDVKPCSSAWKDIIIPGYTDHARAHQMRAWNRDSADRDLLLTFHGRHAGTHDVYAHCAVRTKVMELADKEDVSVGGFVEDYLELKGRSHFCLVPGGTSPWTNHLYESFFAGCIPVILSDEYEVAFQDQLDWPKFSIKWPEAAAGEELYNYLRSFSKSVLQEMKLQVDRTACWFDYFSDDVECSPYTAVMRFLEERRRAFPQWQARFWSVDPLTAEAVATSSDFPRRTTRFHISAGETFGLL